MRVISSISLAFALGIASAFSQAAAPKTDMSDIANEASGAHPPEVIVRRSEAGLTLVDSEGMSLYTYDRDKDLDRKSACEGPSEPSKEANAAASCSQSWPPLLASADAKTYAEWSLVERADGKKQWAIGGRPLYRFAKDAYPGATAGDGMQLIWHIAFTPIVPPLEIAIAPTLKGWTLVNSKGMTLYTYDGDKVGGESSCTDTCLRNWSPVAAPWIARSDDRWRVTVRPDGARQWSYKGKPLYTSANDLRAGDVSGEAVAGWHAVVLQPAPPLPAWMTVHQSDMGKVLADAHGFTVYAFAGDLEKVKHGTCDEDCLKANWRPVTAGENENPVANFSVIVAADGTRQWAYKGDGLYTFVQDVKPGQILGDRFGSGHGPRPVSGGWWRPIVQSCMCMLVTVSQ